MLKLAVIVIYLIVAHQSVVSHQKCDMETPCDAHCYLKIKPELLYVAQLKNQLALTKARPSETVGSGVYHIEHARELSWKNAEEACKKMGAHLAVIEDEEELHALVGNILNQDYWLGLRYDPNESKFVTAMSGKPAPFLKWYDKSDAHRNYYYECVYLTIKNMKTVQCSSAKQYICEFGNEI